LANPSIPAYLRSWLSNKARGPCSIDRRNAARR
jgi:hypothetical protein